MSKYVRNTVRRDSEPGSYNLLNRGDKAYQFYFRFRSPVEINGKERGGYGCTVPEDHIDEIDDTSPLVAAESLLAFMKSHYLYTRSVKELEAVIEYLRPFEEDDERQERLCRINDLRERLAREEEAFALFFGEQAA